jgi:methylmalonyl-CoA epimerase
MKEIEHIGIAVRDLEESSVFYAKLLGVPLPEPRALPERQLRLAFFKAGETKIELLEPSSPESTVAKFLEKRGPGLHHICLRVDDIDAEMERLRREGVRFVDAQPRPGLDKDRIAFIHPESTGGVLVELLEGPAENVS